MRNLEVGREKPSVDRHTKYRVHINTALVGPHSSKLVEFETIEIMKQQIAVAASGGNDVGVVLKSTKDH